MIVPKVYLERKIQEIINSFDKTHWTELIRLNLPPFPNQPYARLKVGKILSNGLHEKETMIVTFYWDGSSIKGRTL